MGHIVRRASLVAAAVFALSACKTEPTEAEKHLAKADELFAKKDYAAAATEYDLALQLEPKQDIKVWEKGAFSYMKSGNIDKAAEILLKTLGPTPDPGKKVERLRDIASMYLSSGNNDKAEQYYAEVMKMDPKDEQSMQWLAEIAAIRGGARANKGPVNFNELDKAIARYDVLIAMSPEQPAAYINKRIAIMRYMAGIQEQKQIAANGGPAVNASWNPDEKTGQLKQMLDDTSKRLGEVNKAARARR